MHIGVMNDWYTTVDGNVQIDTHIFTDDGSMYMLKQNWKRF